MKHYATKPYGGVQVQIHGTQLHAWTAVPPGKEFSVTNERVVGGCAQTQSECCREEEKFLFLPGIKAQSHVCPPHSLVTIPLQLCWTLQYSEF